MRSTVKTSFLRLAVMAPVLAIIALPVSSFASHDDAPFPRYESRRLESGLKVIVHEDHELPVVRFELMIRAGSVDDPVGKEGLAAFTAATLTEGTDTRSAIQIAETIDFVGGSLGADAGYDAAYLSCQVLKKDFELGLELLSDIILHPSFPEAEVERQRSQIVTEIIGDKDQKSTIADHHFQEVLFGNHPYAHPAIGSMESIQTITRDDIVRFYETYFRPNISTIVIAGDVDRESAVSRLEAALGEWKSAILPAAEAPEPVDPIGYRIRLVNKPDVTQSEIRIGYIGIARKDPRYFPLLLMNYVLGAGSFSSRLTQAVRADRGLTYGIYSHLGARLRTGPFTISTFTRTETTLETIRVILDEVERMRGGGITAKELEDAQARYIGGFPLSLETSSQVSQKILEAELYDLGEDYLTRYTAAIDGVGLAEVNAVASEFLRDNNLVIVVVGNAEQLRDDLKSLGEVEEVFYLELEGEIPHMHEH